MARHYETGDSFRQQPAGLEGNRVSATIMHTGIATAFAVNITTGMAPAIMVGVVLMMVAATVLRLAVVPATLRVLGVLGAGIRRPVAAGEPLHQLVAASQCRVDCIDTQAQHIAEAVK
ncbi:MAG: hypothetical protein EPN14_09295 [Gallionella sp.]|nr:MAG: hypothetical protein EPN14_09295 [Gallionella sp.]